MLRSRSALPDGALLWRERLSALQSISANVARSGCGARTLHMERSVVGYMGRSARKSLQHLRGALPALKMFKEIGKSGSQFPRVSVRNHLPARPVPQFYRNPNLDGILDGIWAEIRVFGCNLHPPTFTSVTEICSSGSAPSAVRWGPPTSSPRGALPHLVDLHRALHVNLHRPWMRGSGGAPYGVLP
jgi:hypothetical protein